LLGWKIALGGGVFISTAFLHTVLIFCNIKDNKFLKLVYLLDFIFLYVLLLKMDLLFSGWSIFFGKNYYFCASFYYLIALLGWVTPAIIGLLYLFNLLKVATGIKRVQTMYFFIGSLIGFTGGYTVHLPFFNIAFFPFGNFGVALYPIIVTYAILRYRLMDVRIAITRTGIFIAVYTIVLGIPFIVATLLRPYLIDWIGQDGGRRRLGLWRLWRP